MFHCLLLCFTKVLKHFFCKSISVGMKSFVVALLWAELKCRLLVLPDPGGSTLLSFSLLVALKGSNWLAGSTQNGSEHVRCAGSSYFEFFPPSYSLLFLASENLPFLFALPRHWMSSFFFSSFFLRSHWYLTGFLAWFQSYRLCYRVGLWLLTWLC